MHRTGCTVTMLGNVHLTENILSIQLTTLQSFGTCTDLVFICSELNIFIYTHGFLFIFQSQIYYADLGQIEVAVKNLQSKDIDEKFMKRNSISNICGAKCRTDLEQFVGNIPEEVKGALDDIDEKFMQHNGISKIVDITSCYIGDVVCDCKSF